MKLKPYKTLEQLENEYFGPKGSAKRNIYESELEMEILSEKLRILRKEKNLTQQELGKLVGVQKSQISKLERSVNNTTISTILKVFSALNAKIMIRIDVS